MPLDRNKLETLLARLPAHEQNAARHQIETLYRFGWRDIGFFDDDGKRPAFRGDLFGKRPSGDYDFLPEADDIGGVS